MWRRRPRIPILVDRAVEIDRFSDGLLAGTWTQSDMVGLLAQVGALPE